MKAPEYLDHLIDQHICEGKRFSPIDETIAPMLAAAMLLVQLQEIALPPEFAPQVEVSFRTRTCHLSSR